MEFLLEQISQITHGVVLNRIKPKILSEGAEYPILKFYRNKIGWDNLALMLFLQYGSTMEGGQSDYDAMLFCQI